MIEHIPNIITAVLFGASMAGLLIHLSKREK